MIHYKLPPVNYYYHHKGFLRHDMVSKSLPNISLVHLCSVKPQGPSSGANPTTREPRNTATTTPKRRVSTISVREMLPRYLALLWSPLSVAW